jgi:hypothetical protein
VDTRLYLVLGVVLLMIPWSGEGLHSFLIKSVAKAAELRENLLHLRISCAVQLRDSEDDGGWIIPRKERIC